MALVEEANRSESRPEEERLPVEEFYNKFVSTHFNVQGDYTLWCGGRAPFTFCDYAFLLSPEAKARLLRYEAHCSMQHSVAQVRRAVSVVSPRFCRVFDPTASAGGVILLCSRLSNCRSSIIAARFPLPLSSVLCLW